jgi:hypothetical protein
MTLTGDPLIKGSQIETPLPAIIGAGQSAEAPSPDMVLAIRDWRTFRDREIRSGRGSCVRGWLRRLRDAIDHLRHGGRQDFDVLVVAKPAAADRGRPAGKPLILRLTTRGLWRLRSAGTERISTSTTASMLWRRRGGKSRVQRQMTAHDADSMQKRQLIRVAIHGGAGLYHQAAQREVGQQQTEHLLLVNVGPP